MEMNDKQKFDFNNANMLYRGTTEEEIIKMRVDLLIDALYQPIEGWDRLTKTDPERIKKMGVDDSEPINWGDLKCCGVKKFDDGSFLVFIDEAAPGHCPSLCKYVERFMKSWGWDVRVETEW